jgi:lactoylglutathione lyase
MPAVGAITLFVRDKQVASSWYERALGARVFYEDDDSHVLRFENLVVNLLEVRAAPGLIHPAEVGRAGQGARAVYTLWVADTVGVCDQLTRRGIELVNGPLDRPWGMRTACFADPDGHLWEIAQPIGGEE